VFALPKKDAAAIGAKLKKVYFPTKKTASDHN
jgi:hypothetical protein